MAVGITAMSASLATASPVSAADFDLDGGKDNGTSDPNDIQAKDSGGTLQNSKSADGSFDINSPGKSGPLIQQGKQADELQAKYGGDWTFIDKDDSDGNSDNGFEITGVGAKSGEWSIDASKINVPINEFAIKVKGSTELALYRFDGSLANNPGEGKWTTNVLRTSSGKQPGLSNASLYVDRVPYEAESTLGLLALGVFWGGRKLLQVRQKC